MKAACLLAVLVLAKSLTLVGRHVPWSVWTPVAYFWQDVLVTLIFGGIDRVLRRPATSWTLYGVLVVYVAINVGVTRALSSPLTPTMMRAARGPLADSIAHYFTVSTLGGVALVVVAGALLPWWLARRFAAVDRRVVLAALAFTALGPIAVSKVDTVGMHRNAIVVLLPLSGSRAPAGPSAGDWRASSFEAGAGEDLSGYRGAAKGRNVLLVVLESTAARYLKLYGAAEDPTPNLTALGRRSIVFDNAYAVYPESIKGLFAALCSRDPTYDTSPEMYADVPCASLAAVLRGAGYRAALFHSGRFAYLGMQSVIDKRGFEVLEDAGAIGGNTHSSFGVDESSTVRRILGWIDSLDPRERFFVTYLPIAGHHPYATPTPGPFDGATDLGQYRNALHDGDAALGELLAGLGARHLDDRTLVVVFGDHGEAFGQHDGNFGHTMFIYDENVHVPYLVAMPALTSPTRLPQRSPGLHVSRVASVLDTAPTVLDLLGLPPSPEHRGVSLLGPGRRMALFYTDYSLGWLGLRDGCWKYLYEIDDDRSKLFDVCVDPDERRDQTTVPGLQARVGAYRIRLQQWRVAQRDAIARAR